MISIARKNKTLTFGLSIVKAYDTNKMFPTKEKMKRKLAFSLEIQGKAEHKEMECFHSFIYFQGSPYTHS